MPVLDDTSKVRSCYRTVASFAVIDVHGASSSSSSASSSSSSSTSSTSPDPNDVIDVHGAATRPKRPHRRHVVHGARRSFQKRYGCFSKQCTSEIRRTLQTFTVYFSRVSYLFERNANDTYVLRMTHINYVLNHHILNIRLMERTLQVPLTRRHIIYVNFLFFYLRNYFHQP